MSTILSGIKHNLPGGLSLGVGIIKLDDGRVVHYHWLPTVTANIAQDLPTAENVPQDCSGSPQRADLDHRPGTGLAD